MKKLVLIVDENPMSGTTSKTFFNELGWDAVLVSSGKAALEILKYSVDKFHLIFCDYSVEDMTALLLHEEIRSMLPSEMPKFVVLAKKKSEKDEIKKDDVLILPKPFLFFELIKFLNLNKM